MTVRHLANPAACLATAQRTFAASVAELDAELAESVASGDVDAETVAAYERAKATMGDALAFVATLDQSGDRFHRILADIQNDTAVSRLLDMTAKRCADIRALIA